MPLRVVSLRKGGTEPEDGETVLYVGRPHPLGNPYPLLSERNRDTVIDGYEAWLTRRLAYPGSMQAAMLAQLVDRNRAGERIALQCWCAPKRCHADIIKRLVEEKT